jgi:hypothetical protein
MFDRHTITSVCFRDATGTRLKGDIAVDVVMDDGSVKTVLAYYSDELHFVEADFIGKTQQQVDALFTERDVAYLRS